ncbi:MAG: PilN domain-containing protein [Fibrobacterales bacterium]
MERIELNLIPIEHRLSKMDHTWMLDRRVIYPSFILLIELVIFAIAWITISETNRQLNNDLEAINHKIRLQAPIQKEIKTLDDALQKKKRKNRALKSIEVSKKRWIEIFEDISTTLPGNMWVLSIIQNKEVSKEVLMKGVTYNFSEISQYMMALEEQRSFEELLLNSIITIKYKSNTAYQFEIKCILKESVE